MPNRTHKVYPYVPHKRWRGAKLHSMSDTNYDITPDAGMFHLQKRKTTDTDRTIKETFHKYKSNKIYKILINFQTDTTDKQEKTNNNLFCLV